MAVVLDLTNELADDMMLTGRSALAYRMLVSSDPRVIMVLTRLPYDFHAHPFWCIPASRSTLEGMDQVTEMVGRARMANMNLSIYHAIRYEYDDTNTVEMVDNISDKAWIDFAHWLHDHMNDKGHGIDTYENMTRVLERTLDVMRECENYAHLDDHLSKSFEEASLYGK